MQLPNGWAIQSEGFWTFVLGASFLKWIYVPMESELRRSILYSLSWGLDTSKPFSTLSEFEDPRGSEQWTKRVMELRQSWSAEQETMD